MTLTTPPYKYLNLKTIFGASFSSLFSSALLISANAFANNSLSVSKYYTSRYILKFLILTVSFSYLLLSSTASAEYIFDGTNDYVSISVNNAPQGANNRTLAFWAQQDYGASAWPGLVSYGSQNANKLYGIYGGGSSGTNWKWQLWGG